MRKLVLASGLWNAGVGASLLVPAFYRRVGVDIAEPFWGWSLAAFIFFTAAVLIMASRDLERRASMVYWEALLRFASAALLLSIGRDIIGWMAWLIGITDILWALVYTFGLPRALQVSHRALLLDAVASQPRTSRPGAPS